MAERREDYGTVGLFLWRSSANKGDKFYNHWDYGYLPAIATESGFAPTRLAFKGADGLGRDSVLSPTGLGTAGFGLHIKDINTLPKISHTLRGAYIRGTSSAPQEGGPAGEQVYSVARPSIKEPSVMGDKDYAYELDFDTKYIASKYINAFLKTAYIKSGFKNKKYDKDIFNIEMLIRVFI